MTRTGFFLRLAVSIVIDLADFTIGRALIPIPWEEGVGALILSLMWGPAGLLYVAELADMTEQIDAFIPLATLIGLYVGWREGHLFGKSGSRPPASAPIVKGKTS
ncbi:MAG: hypothetical protein ACOYJ6_14970 [Caulobacterales bacterium]|jgi:hypothetical protein